MGAVVVALSGTVAACGGDEETTTPAPGTDEPAVSGGGTIKLYSSLPLTGASRPQSEDVVNGIELALKQVDNMAGGFTINYESLDDATAAAGQWDAAQTKANAREVAQDDAAITYIGEFNSGASANSIPTLNEANILQVSPSNTALGLTKAGDGAEPGEPDKYYPAGTRTYGRVVPIDTIQGAAQAQFMKDEGVTSVYILDDNEVYGKGVAANTATAVEEAGIEIAGTDSWDGKAANFRALADKVAATDADAVFTGGIIDNNAPQLYKDLNAALPEAKLFGPDGVATVDFTKEIPPEVQAQTYITSPTVSPEELPPDGQKFYEDFSKEYDQATDEVDPYAIYGYEAARVIIDCIEESGDSIDAEDLAGGGRQAVIDCFFATENRDSPLGTYSIDDDGDTTLTTYGGYIAKGGKLVFQKAIEQEGA